MSRRRDTSLPARLRPQAPVFAALGDETRLRLVGTLCRGQPRSISRLTEGSELSRQAMTKHLRVLEGAGLVHSARRGREILFMLAPGPIEAARDCLAMVSWQWDQALSRLKAFVEKGGGPRPPPGGRARRRPVAA
jgi:DNA-binding transcriptional ArsR family regulator